MKVVRRKNGRNCWKLLKLKVARRFDSCDESGNETKAVQDSRRNKLNRKKLAN